VKKEPKAPKAPKVPKPPKDPALAKPRLPKFPDTDVITIFKENAKSRTANDRFMRYTTGMTVKQYLDKIKEDFGRSDGQTYADMRWDMEHKFIHIGPTVVAVPPPEPKPEKPKAEATAATQATTPAPATAAATATPAAAPTH
jgi:hypothetical protein